MCFLFVIADSIYNLREENKQLRKAHHDIHTQLQDAQVRQKTSQSFMKTGINLERNTSYPKFLL